MSIASLYVCTDSEMISFLWRGESMDVCEDDLGFDYEMEINEDDDGKVAK